MLIDTHAHLYWESYKKDFNDVIQRSLDTGVTTIINVGVDVEKSKKALEQTEELSKNKNFSAYSTIGLHPHEAVKYSSPSDVSIHKDMAELESIYQTNTAKVVAVGECGLDYFLDRNDIYPDITLPYNQIKELQRQLFQAQINIAKTAAPNLENMK